MDVTFSNFKEKLSLIKDAISNSSFLSVDGEFTGLNQSWNLNAYDTPAERYSKVKQDAEDFLLIQFGLCTFHYDSETKQYHHQAFNFYVFPRMYKKITPDHRFYCQASSLEFLVTQGFDFNKLYKEGIPYIRAVDEDSLRSALTERQAQREEDRVALEGNFSNGTSQTTCPVPEEHRDFIDNVHSQVKDLMSSEKTTIQLSPCSAFRRKLIFETVRAMFSDLDMETIRTDKGLPYIQVTKVSKDELKNRVQARNDEEKDQLEEAIGFTKVIKMITESGKLVVGHNMFLDLLHIINQFGCQLPKDYEEFKEVAKSVLPRVLDTKLMASINPFKEHFSSTGLNDTLKRLNEKPFSCSVVEPSENCPGYNTATEQLHEAGYDAYITGLCFISMEKYLNSIRKKSKKTNCDCGSSPLIEPFVNKVFMMKSPDIPYLNLGGRELQPSRDHIYFTTFPKEWKQQNIYDLFTSIGPVSIAWINDTSAFVALRYPEKAKSSGAKHLLKNTKEECRVHHFSQYAEQQKALSDPTAPKAVPPGVKRKSTERKSSSDSPENDAAVVPVSEEEGTANEDPNPKRSKLENKLFEEPSNWD